MNKGIFVCTYYKGNKQKMKRGFYMDTIALILIIIGAINWGSIGLFGFDLVGAIFGGQGALLSRIIFAVVGLAGLWAVTFLFRDRTEVREAHMHK